MRIVSWNVNSLNVRLPHLQQWLGDFAPDVVGLQETKLEDHKFPDAELAALGYRSVFSGQKTYNGVAIVSRQEPREVLVGVPGFEHEHRRAISATLGDLRIVNLYVVNGQDVGTDKYELKLAWLAAVRDWLEDEARRHPHLPVLDRRRGDPAGDREPVLARQAALIPTAGGLVIRPARSRPGRGRWAAPRCAAHGRCRPP